MSMFLLPTFMMMIGAAEDLRTRKITNGLNLSFLALAFLFQYWTQGFDGLQSAGLGALTALVLCTPLFLLRLFGGGDLKLLVAIGALIGVPNLILLLPLSLAWGAVFGLVRALAGGQLTAVGHNILAMVITRKPLPESAVLRIPFTIPILLGWITFWQLHILGVL